MKKIRGMFMLLPLLIPFHLLAQGTRPGHVDTGAPFGELRLIDEIDCGNPKTPHAFKESTNNLTRIETILGKPCRVMDNKGPDAYFAYQIGKNKGLRAGAAYLLAIEYPEDTSRSMFIINRANDAWEGIYTGQAIGDVLYTYTYNNPESLKIPLANSYKEYKQLFFMGERTASFRLSRDTPKMAERVNEPSQGFWVLIGKAKEQSDPLSAGPAISRIRLYEIKDIEEYFLEINYPPAELPRRYTFVREEMGDGIALNMGGMGLYNDERIYFENKAKMMRFLGMNTYCKDLLEFGHNQGWESKGFFVVSQTPKRWENILDIAHQYGLYVLPYYEYAGSTEGLGRQKRAKTLKGGNHYTHIHWSENFNIDVTDPDSLEDSKKLLDYTMIRYLDKAPFIGAWFRNRVGHIPIGFGDSTLRRFMEANPDLGEVTREKLINDKALLDKYYSWWFKKRRDFFVALQAYLYEKGLKNNPAILFTSFSGEPGPAASEGFGFSPIFTDDVETWKKVLSEQAGHNDRNRPVSFEEYISRNGYLQAVTNFPSTWGEWEWNHADPPSDPRNYQETENVYLTYPINRAFMSATEDLFEPFRTKTGLATVKVYPLNEIGMRAEKVGYFTADMERPGPYSMMAEILTMAHGDPRFIGYLSGNLYARGYSEYVRKFNAAFLSLPALPSVVVKDGSSDPDVIVRMIKTEKHGTYFAVINTALTEKRTVTITFPTGGEIINTMNGRGLGAKLPAEGGKIRLNFAPLEMKTFLLK